MKYKFQYTDINARKQLLAENSDKILVEEQNVTEGNFLIFSDTPLQAPIIYTQLPKEDFDRLEQQRQNDSLTQFDVLATIYEELMMKG